ncbi:hypothetical protein [Sphingopyxis witflariensis]|nr:hypothetical protein [Sphingopyxis witflariensis]
MTKMTERRAARSMALLLLAGASVPALAQETPLPRLRMAPTLS